MLKVKDIMSQNVVSIRGCATVAEAVQIMNDKKLQALIVERRTGDRTVGILTKDDIIYKIAALGQNPKTMQVYKIMTRPCVTVQPEMDIESAARLFASTPIFCAPVIGNEPLGIVSASDIKAMLCIEQSGKMAKEEELTVTRSESSAFPDAGYIPSQHVRQVGVPVLQ